jgi:UDP-2,3-diacylglucosamine pyrophosphatase LpxH
LGFDGNLYGVRLILVVRIIINNASNISAFVVKLPEMNAIVVSDLHIGSRYFLIEIFERFLTSIPWDCELILNGDVIDNVYMKLPPPHQKILDLIEQISHRQKVVWVRGNHDNGYIPQGFGKVEFKDIHVIEQRVLLAHGDYFDGVMPRSQLFMKAFKLMHDLRVKLGAKPVHVAEYAKKWKSFYRFLRQNIMKNAVNYAEENGYAAVVCGHTHYPEDKVVKGIRYVNLGAWTELPAFYLHINGDEMALKQVEKQSDSPDPLGVDDSDF